VTSTLTRLSHMRIFTMQVRKCRFYVLPYLENRFRSSILSSS